MSRIREHRESKTHNEVENLRRRFNQMDESRSKPVNEQRKSEFTRRDDSEEIWEKDTYELSDLVSNTEVCIHCMGNKCKRMNEEGHKNVFFPRKFSEYINSPIKLNELKNLKKTSIQDRDFGDLKIVFTVCMYNLCNGKCKGYSAGRHGIIETEDNKKYVYCYSDLNYVQKNILFIGLHVDIKLTKTERNNILIESYPLHIEYKKPVVEDMDDNISVNSQLSKLSQNYENKNVKKDWVNIIKKNEVLNESNEDFIIEKKEESNIQLNIENIQNIENIENNKSNELSTPKTKDLYENFDSNSNNNKQEVENNNQKMIRYIQHSCDFMDYQYDENNRLHTKIQNLEDKIDQLILLNNNLLHQIQFRKDENLKRYKEALKECDNAVSEQINRTELDKYFHFF